MNVNVRVATILARKADPPLGSPSLTASVAEGTDIENLVLELGIPLDLVGTVTLNKKRSNMSTVLEEGDLVAVLPSISGG